MAGIDHQHHRLTCILQVRPGGQQDGPLPIFPEGRLEERMGACRLSLAAPLTTDRDEGNRERGDSLRNFLRRDAGRLPAYCDGGGV
jgi:hypothetical protein